MIARRLQQVLLLFSALVAVSSASSSCPTVPLGGCSICGDDKCVGNLEAVVEDDNELITCGELENKGLAGNLALPRCFLLEQRIFDVCECRETEDEPLEPLTSIYDTIAHDSQFSILKGLLDTTSLRDALDGEDVLTVFAPNDDVSRNGTLLFSAIQKDSSHSVCITQAFDKLDDINSIGVEDLKAIILYHVVPGSLTRNDMQEGIVKNINNDIITLDIKRSGQVEINEVAKIQEFDILTSNGVIHIINEVLIPPPNLVDLDDDRLTIFRSLVDRAGLVETLATAQDLTVFAPSNSVRSCVTKFEKEARNSHPLMHCLYYLFQNTTFSSGI